MEKKNLSLRQLKTQILQEALEYHKCEDCSFKEECKDHVKDHDMDLCLEMMYEFDEEED